MPGRLGADGDLRLWPGRRPRGDRTEPSSFPAPPHRRCAVSMPREEPWRRRPAPAAESTGHRHPQFLPGGRQFLFFVGGPDAVRGVYLGSLGSSRGDASRGVRHARRIRRARLAAVHPPGNALGAALRSRATNAQRRADRRRRLRRLRAHRRHRCVFDVGCGRDGLSGGAALGDPALVVRPIGQRARHARIARADRPVESQAVAGWPSRGRRTLAAERDGPVAARFHAPDALHPRV